MKDWTPRLLLEQHYGVEVLKGSLDGFHLQGQLNGTGALKGQLGRLKGPRKYLGICRESLEDIGTVKRNKGALRV